MIKDIKSNKLNFDISNLLKIRDIVYSPFIVSVAISPLNLFNYLYKKEKNLLEICRDKKIHQRPAKAMLDVLLSFGLLKKSKKGYYNLTKSSLYLTKDFGFDISGYIEQSALFESSIKNRILSVLKTDQPLSIDDDKNWEKAMEGNFSKFFTEVMDSRGAFLAKAFVKKIKENKNFGIKKIKMLDIGGSSGIFSSILVSLIKKSEATIFEKYPVDKVAKKYIKARFLDDVVSVICGDMFKDDLPEGYNIHLYSHVFHDWNEKQNTELLKKSYRSLPKGGLVIIHDKHLNEKNMEEFAEISHYSLMLALLTRGRCYSVDEIKYLLKIVGFKSIKYIPTGVSNRSLIVGKK